MGTQPTLEEWLDSEGYEHGIDSAPNRSGLTPLMQAARQGEVAIVALLLEADIDIHATNADGNNALWLACYAESLGTIGLLLEVGISLNHQNRSGATCLMFAASSGKDRIVAELLRHGAQRALRTFDDFSALDLASTEECLRHLRA